MTELLIHLCDAAYVIGVCGIVGGLIALVTSSPDREDHR